ncbi:MAG: FecR family protein [Paludibacter sp.]
MIADYSKYKVSNFLTDDYFIDSMLHPTCESEDFWKFQLDEKIINVDEFIAAYMTLKSLHENKPKVKNERLEIIWNRIESTKNSQYRRKQHFKIFSYAAVACCILGFVSISYLKFFNADKEVYSQSISDFAKENIIHTEQPTKQIQLVSGSQTLAVDGAQANVEYDENGKLKVNKQSMAVNKAEKVAKDEIIYNQLRVPYGKRAFLTLSDGSTLWVNTGTTVIYPVTFAKDKREIFVEGEVFAEVAHDAKRPFFIKTEKLDVRVLGTVFNVTAYKEDKQTNVVLVSGSVNVKPKNGKATLIKPNQLFAYSDNATTLTEVDVENYTSWHEGNYKFKNEPIENILLRLSRYYNVTMKLPTEPTGISCSGKLELKDDLTQLLNGLSEITSMNFAKKDNEYRIMFK